jgi:small-conductance mechanosensitive channel
VAFLEASFTATLATAGTALLSMSFVFATTAQEVLGSCIFLFVKHPYDVGDRVDINNEHLTVEHIALLYSIFKRVDNHKIVQIPHVVLNSGWIENVSRSKAMREQVKIYINFDTTMEDINLLKNEIQAFVLSKEHSRDFFPEVEVEVLGIAEMNKLELKVEVKHKVCSNAILGS